MTTASASTHRVVDTRPLDSSGHSPALDPRWAWGLVAGVLCLSGCVLVGIAGTAITGAVIGLCSVAIVVGTIRNRPTLSWPLWVFVGAGAFWLLAGAGRELLPTDDRLGGTSVWADVIAWPGYAFYAAGLIGLIRARDGRNRGALVDAVVVSIGGFLVAWQTLISRTLDTPGVSTMERVTIVSFLVLDCGLVTLACRLAFGASNRLPSHALILVAMCGLFASDVLTTIDSLGIADIGERMELGYLIAAAAMGAAALHPSIRRAHVQTPVRRRTLPMGRAALLAMSLLLPAVQVATGATRSLASMPYQLGVIALAITATIRLLDSVRSQNEATDALSWQATHDGLTQLPNRDAIAALIDRRMQTRPGGDVIAFFDLDRFKNVNDAFGHAFGDRLLVAVAERLHERLPGDAVVGRIGGDEFVVVVAADTMGTAELVAHIQSALSHPFVLDGSVITTSASIGLTTTAGGADAHAILRDGDTAMYRAKAGGRNTFRLFSDDMRVQVERRMDLERRLRQALDQGGEITTWFQPVIDLATGETEGFEALARWIRPDGMIQPAEFIPVAEESGLVCRLGELVLDEACAGVAAARRRSGRSLFVSVNVSVRQLADDSIVDVVERTLERHGLPGSALCLEVTESIMMNDRDIERLYALRRLGVWLAVDDFGTGYSSLSYLRKMPVSKVKIDKSFVDDVEHGDASILVAILSMAHSLRLACIAEGVETEGQARRLTELGCGSGQGYLWSKPAPIGVALADLEPLARAR